MDRGRIVASLLLAALPARALLDVAHSVSPAAARIGAGILAVGLLGCAAATLPSWRSHRLGRLALLWTVLVLIGALRASTAAEAVRLSLLYLAAPAFGLAVGAQIRGADRERWLRYAAGAGFLCVALSLVDLLGAPDLVLHGHARWLGAYASHHAHGLAMAIFALLGLVLGTRGRQVGWWLAAGALVALASTWVRTAWLLVVLTLGVTLALRWRWRALGILSTALAASCLHPAVRDRFSDLGAVLTFRAPQGGWEAIGSWRGRIWLETWEGFTAQGPMAWLWGRGLGGHDDLYRALDPHQEYLALWYQLGLLGPVLLAVALCLALAEALRARRWEPELAAVTAGLVVSVGLLGAVSNVLLERPLVGMVLWGLVGLVSSARPRRGAWAENVPAGQRSAA